MESWSPFFAEDLRSPPFLAYELRGESGKIIFVGFLSFCLSCFLSAKETSFSQVLRVVLWPCGEQTEIEELPMKEWLVGEDNRGNLSVNRKMTSREIPHASH